MSTFTGNMMIYDFSGELINDVTFTDGVSSEDNSNPFPCPDDTQDEDPDDTEDDDSGDGSSSGAGDPDWSDGTVDEGDYDGNPHGNGSGAGGGGCIVQVVFVQCTGDNSNIPHSASVCGAEPPTGSYYTINMSAGCRVATGVDNNSDEAEPDPCDPGDVGVILDDDDCDTSKEDLKKVFPNTSDEKLKEIAKAINEHAEDFGIDNKEKLRHFIAQAGHESASFTDFTENLNYRVKKLGISYWKTKFNPYTAYIDSLNIDVDSTKQNPNDYASSTSTVFVDNEEFANFVYDDANRGSAYKLGNTSDGDGYKYRGRGIFQLTGKTNYSNFNTYYQENIDEDTDLVENPELVASNKEIAVISALWFYEKNVLDEITIDSTTTVQKVTKEVNGGRNGLEDRKEIFEDCEEHIDCVEE